MSSYNYAKAKASVTKAKSLGSSGSTGWSNNSQYNRDPFGPGMAEDVFNTYDNLDDCVEEMDSEPYFFPKDHVEQEEMFGGTLESHHFTWQGELEIETQQELEGKLRRSINRFDQAYGRMCLYALKWHYLQEELDNDPHLKKMFGDIQLMRKLKGSDRV